MEPDDLLTINQVASELDVNPATVWREIKRERLRATNLGKQFVIIRRDLDAYKQLPKLRPGPRKAPPPPPDA